MKQTTTAFIGNPLFSHKLFSRKATKELRGISYNKVALFLQKTLFFFIFLLAITTTSNAQKKDYIFTFNGLDTTAIQLPICYDARIKITVQAPNSLADSTYFPLYRRVDTTGNGTWSKWINVSHFKSYKQNIGVSILIISQLFNTNYGNNAAFTNPPNNTLPYTAPLKVQLVLCNSIISNNQNAPNLTTSTISNIITVTLNPIPKVITHPATTVFNYCRNTPNVTPFFIEDTLPNINNNKYKWLVSTPTINNTANNLTTADTFKIYSPKTIAAGTSFYYSCKITNQFGCTVSSNKSGAVTIRDTTTNNKLFTICDYQLPFTYAGLTFTAAGTKIRDTINVWGCDSNIKVTVALYAASKKTVTTKNLCLKNGDYYTWAVNNKQYYASAKDTVHYTLPPSTCDSLCILNLVVNKRYDTTVNMLYCSPNNEAYVWNGISCPASGVYNKTFILASKCDSVVHLNLTYSHITTTTTNTSICTGDSVYFKQSFIKIAGTYKDTLHNNKGCDSILILVLKIKANTFSTTNISICPKDTASYSWNNHHYAASGSYVVHLINKAGCDSVATLNLVVKQNSYKTIDTFVCRPAFRGNWAGYWFIDTAIKEAGTYIKTILNSVGCDSVITLHLTIYASTLKDTTVYICSNCVYSFFGQDLNNTGGL
jgi:hypothetical protein